MCGRFGFDMPKETLERAFGVRVPEAVPPSWNIAPGQPILAVNLFEGSRELMGFLWGLVPTWANGSKGDSRGGFANARSETVFEKPAFRDSIRYFRCVVPASFFYEWKKEGGTKIPHLIRLQDNEPMAFAAIYAEPRNPSRFRPGGGLKSEAVPALPSPTLALLTTEANHAMRTVHDRMPVILAPDELSPWLDPYAKKDTLNDLMRPYSGKLEMFPVSTRVNKTSENDPALAEPAPRAPVQGSLL